jgi:hypothetical protein
MTHENSINNMFVPSSSIGIIFVKSKGPFMLEDKSNNVKKKYKLKDKFITTYKDYGIEAHVKRNCFDLGNRFESKNQNLDNTG